MPEIPETYVRTALYGVALFIKDDILWEAPIRHDGSINWTLSRETDWDKLDDEEHDQYVSCYDALEMVAQ